MTRLDYDIHKMAADYAANRKIHPGVLEQLIEVGGLGPGSRVLEVGIGTGNYAAAIQTLTGASVSGIDPSEDMLTHAATQDAPLDLHHGRAEELPFPDGSFDLVYSVDVIHHVGDRPAYFREAARVLSPGGKLCTVTDSEEDIARRVPLSSHFPETVPVELARYPSLGTLAQEMMLAGFGAIHEGHAERVYDLVDISGYRNRAYSSLHLIDEAAHRRGVERLEADLANGPVRALSLYTLLWGIPRG